MDKEKRREREGPVEYLLLPAARQELGALGSCDRALAPHRLGEWVCEGTVKAATTSRLHKHKYLTDTTSDRRYTKD